jgi:dsRNA-specific ribonuclease
VAAFSETSDINTTQGSISPPRDNLLSPLNSAPQLLHQSAFDFDRHLGFHQRFESFKVWLGELTGYQVVDENLFRLALTHPSSFSKVGHNYERLEYLGDAGLNLWITDMEVRAGHGCHGRKTGKISEVAKFVSNQFLSNACIGSGLADFALSASDQTFDLGKKAAGDLVESVTAAIFIDSGSFQQTGKFINAVLGNVRSFRDFLSKYQEVPLPTEDRLLLPPAIRDFVDALGFDGRGDRLFHQALRSDLCEGRGNKDFADLYGLGNRAHQLLCREQVYFRFPGSNECQLSHLAIDLGKKIIKQVVASPPWAGGAFEEFRFAEHAAANSFKPEGINQMIQPVDVPASPEVGQRYHALIGAVYRLGGLEAVQLRFGDLYSGTNLEEPPPSSPFATAPELLQGHRDALPVDLLGVAGSLSSPLQRAG